MLRVTIHQEELIDAWELEGKLSGEWVKELERCWTEIPAGAGRPVQLNLKAVSYIDAAGKQLLTAMYEAGVEIKGCGCMTRAVVEEIMRETKAR